MAYLAAREANGYNAELVALGKELGLDCRRRSHVAIGARKPCQLKWAE